MERDELIFENKDYCPLPAVEKSSSFEIKELFKKSLAFFVLILVSFLARSYFKTEVRNVASQAPQTDTELQTLELSPVLVNFTSSEGLRTAHVSAKIKTRYSHVKNKILNNQNEFHKHLLFILSEKEIENINKNKSQFEQQIVSQMNVFLPKGKVEKVVLHTKVLN